MATHAMVKAVHFTLTATTVDTVTFREYAGDVLIVNRVGADPLWITDSGVDPVAEADDCYWIGEGMTLSLPKGRYTSIKILGNGNDVTVQVAG